MVDRMPLSGYAGLTDEAAQQRLKAEGYNELPTAKRSGALAIAWEVVKEPMFLLLLVCGGIYLVLGETSDAMMLLAFVFVIIGITFYQERKTERALEALRDLSSPRALVIRDGEEKRIAGREVVRDDIIIVTEGDRVPADATLLETTYLSVDESLLTGESMPVRKVSDSGNRAEACRPGGDDLPWLFSGTLVVKGKGIARVSSTGFRTEIGKIGKALQTVESNETPLNKQTGKLVRYFAATGFVICLSIVLFFGLVRAQWMDGILAGITLAMAMIPEEFPVVLSIFLALGAWRIAQKHVLTRRIPAVEALGAATVLCVDKTGTLTQNRMSVRRLSVDEGEFDIRAGQAAPLPEPVHAVIEYGILASQLDPFDPMEKAFRELGDLALANTEHLHRDWVLEYQYPLSDKLLAMSHVWRCPQTGARAIAAKGAPEAIADLCHVPSEMRETIMTQVNRLASDGLRVLAVAKASLDESVFPEDQHDFDFEFLGLAGFEDPVRSSVRTAMEECSEACVRVVMITGDYPATAMNIARQIAFPNPDKAITGAELDALSDADLARKAHDVSIFARVVPEQKLRIVNAFKGADEIAAMTGDGVNDAPALKSADIGIAMGGRGTDVAREAADLVLLDDDFSSIVHAIRLGRRIFDNLQKAIAYILAVHVPIAGLSLLPVLLGWPLILLPLHIVFLEMVIDPACSVVFEVEPEEKGLMKRPPRRKDAPLLSPMSLAICLAQGLGVLAVVILLFAMSQHRGFTENEARSVTFATLLFGNLALIVSNRSRTQHFVSILMTPNRAIWWVMGAAVAFLLIAVYVPFLRDGFHFAPLHVTDLLLVFLSGCVILAWLELIKIAPRVLGYGKDDKQPA